MTPLPLPTRRTSPAEAPEWIEIEDDASDRTWRFDVAFLTSRWRCIYGEGCRGIHETQDPARADGCCTVGAQLTDVFDFQTVNRAVARLEKDDWQHRAHALRKGWFKRRPDATIATRVVDGGCVFLNRPGFSGGPGCALHRAALRAGEHPVEWKPYVCWQLPLRRDDSTGDDGHELSVLRRWSKADWGADGAHLEWWCTESDDAFDAAEPVWATLATELRAILGDVVYDELAMQLAAITIT